MPISVLVVEDEPMIRFAAVTNLEDEGFDVVEATNADQAIAILTARPDIHILFTDIDMPGSMDGLKLSAFVRDRWPPVRIIVTSGKRLVEITELPAGSVFFPKPYGLDAIATSIRQLLSNASRPSAGH
ncbi:MAG: response regulator [Devosia sp.]